MIKLYHTITFDFSEQIKFIYRNLGCITCAIVIENDTLLQEVDEFSGEVINHIDSDILGRCIYKAPGLDGSLEAPDGIQRTTARDSNGIPIIQKEDQDKNKYAVFNEKNAEANLKKHQKELENFLSKWNKDPEKRPKLATLTKELEETK